MSHAAPIKMNLEQKVERWLDAYCHIVVKWRKFYAKQPSVTRQVRCQQALQDNLDQAKQVMTLMLDCPLEGQQFANLWYQYLTAVHDLVRNTALKQGSWLAVNTPTRPVDDLYLHQTSQALLNYWNRFFDGFGVLRQAWLIGLDRLWGLVHIGSPTRRQTKRGFQRAVQTFGLRLYESAWHRRQAMLAEAQYVVEDTQ